MIDDKVISFEQYKKVLMPLIDQFEEKKIKLVMAVNKGDVEFYRYYKNHKGTIRLPYVIYEGLHGSLSWNYQFLHQEAMCELRMARREKSSDKRKSILELSYRNIVRARELTEGVVSDKIEYTRAHMDVTKALILINYVFSGEKGQIKNTICACYDAFVTGGPLCSQLKKDEMKDVKKFLESNWAEWLEEDGDAIDKFNELYSEYSRKPSWVVNVV